MGAVEGERPCERPNRPSKTLDVCAAPFRRQHPIGPYVLDFYCAKARLAVEVDGISHDLGDQPQRDLRRDAWLEASGVSVMRIPATEAMRDIDDAVDAIVRAAIAKIDA